MTTPTYLAEVQVDAARGEIARIYGEIRRLTGGPLVAFVYRHLATLPGALEALWRSVAPLLEKGELQTRAWDAAARAWTSPVPDSRNILGGLGAPGTAGACRVIDAYNRGNPVNLAVVSVIRAAAGSPAIPAQAIPRTQRWTPPDPLAPIIPIPAANDLDAKLLAQVDAFGKRDRAGEALLVPTLYRHLSAWPALIDFAIQEVRPRLADGSFAAAIDRFRLEIEQLATELAQRHVVPVEAVLATPAVRNAFDRFAPVIPEMVVVGHFLRRALDCP